MTKDDAIVSRDLLDIFDIEMGEQILVKYEFLSFLPSQYQSFSNIIFDEKVGSSSSENSDSN